MHAKGDVCSTTELGPEDLPASRESPLSTPTCLTRPSQGDCTAVSIFMADSTASFFPAFTSEPAQHSMPLNVHQALNDVVSQQDLTTAVTLMKVTMHAVCTL